MLSTCWKEGVAPASIINGFRTTGVFPVDRTKYPVTKFSPLQYQSYLHQQQQFPLHPPTGTPLQLPPTAASAPQLLPPSLQLRPMAANTPQLLPPSLQLGHTAAVTTRRLPPPLQLRPTPPQIPASLHVQLPDQMDASTSRSAGTLQEFFISRSISSRAGPSGDRALRRKKIQQHAAVSHP